MPEIQMPTYTGTDNMVKRRAVLVTLLRSAAILAVMASISVAQQPVTKLAFKAYLANKTDSAAALFKIAVRQHPSDASLRAWQAEAALRSSNPAEALQAAEDAIIVSRVALLGNELAVQRDRGLARNRERWVSNFLRRAGIDWPTIHRTLEAFRPLNPG
jgi:hypothetical protein